MSEDTQEVSEQVKTAEEEGMAAFGAAAAAIKEDNAAEEPQPAAVIQPDDKEVKPAETAEGEAPAEAAPAAVPAEGAAPEEGAAPAAKPDAAAVPPATVAPALQALNEAVGIKEEKPAAVPPIAEPATVEPSEAEKALQAQVATLEAEKAEYLKANPPPTLSIKERIDAIEDETKRTAMQEQYELYPDLMNTMLSLMPAAQPAAEAEGTVTEQVNAILKERDEAQQASRTAADKYVADVVNGYKDEAGNDVAGHKDAVEMSNTKEFNDWLATQPEPIRAILNGGNPGHTIKLMSAYKEHAVLTAKTTEDDKARKKLEDQDSLNSDTVRGITPSPVDDKGQPVDMDKEFAAAAKAVAAQA